MECSLNCSAWHTEIYFQPLLHLPIPSFISESSSPSSNAGKHHWVWSSGCKLQGEGLNWNPSYSITSSVTFNTLCILSKFQLYCQKNNCVFLIILWYKLILSLKKYLLEYLLCAWCCCRSLRYLTQAKNSQGSLPLGNLKLSKGQINNEQNT